MNEEKTFAQKVIQFDENLSNISIELPEGFKIINPFNGDKKETVRKISTSFYKRFYNDRNNRRLILGSSPARRGTAVTGVPFEDALHLQYGGCEKFYSDFYMNFVCPIGIVKTNSKGKNVNCNYYDNKKLQETLYSLIINSIKSQINFGIDTSVCYCIGSGKNYDFMTKINNKYHFFKKIIPLEHPRFIMQYNSKHKDEFLKKYLEALNADLNK